VSTHNPWQRPPFGFNVIGFASGNFGLAVAARNTVRMLVERGFEVRVIDIDAGGGRSGIDQTYTHLESPDAIEAPYAINLFHMNPPDIMRVMRGKPEWLKLSDRLNVCVPFWELSKLPDAWVPLLETMDLTLCPSRFVLDSVESSAPLSRCVHYPQGVFLPDDIVSNRSRFNLPEDRILFLVSIDLGSDIDRKNPFAAIEAFRLAFPQNDGQATLVIKLNNEKVARQHFHGAQQLAELVSGRSDIILIEESMPYLDALSLYASCDALVSLHRSEGLGLHLLEAMMLGKPVVCTGWSGNMDFTTPENSLLVDYEFVPVESHHASYAPSAIGEGQVWAEPDVEQAAMYFRKLAGDPALRASLGKAARTSMLRRQTEYTKGRVADTMASAWEHAAAIHADNVTATRRLDRRLYRWARRRTGRLLRKLGLRS